MTDEGPIDSAVQFFTSHGTTAKLFNWRTVFGRYPPAGLFPLLDRSSSNAKAICKRLHSQPGRFGGPIQGVFHDVVH
ncbi:hypothetical protein BVI1335_320051 [Burkholderia vietnamiensis]|nr:hypothetical protein BVI1335_320051 [Burkholderia vietnamiensis]